MSETAKTNRHDGTGATTTETWRRALARSFDAAADALERALRQCPERLWEESMWPVRRTDPFIWPAEGGEGARPRIWVKEGGEIVARGERTEEAVQAFSAFWCVAYHALFFLDYYLSRGEDEGFSPPAPFQDEQGVGPDRAALFPCRVYRRGELLAYLAHDRAKARATIAALSDTEAARPCGPGSPNEGTPFADLLLGTLAHTAEHTSQLAMFLGQRAEAP